MSARSVIVSGVRTPIGRFRGGLAPMQAVDLGGVAIREALARARQATSPVAYTLVGPVIQAGGGGAPRRPVPAPG